MCHRPVSFPLRGASPSLGTPGQLDAGDTLTQERKESLYPDTSFQLSLLDIFTEADPIAQGLGNFVVEEGG